MNSGEIRSRRAASADLPIALAASALRSGAPSARARRNLLRRHHSGSRPFGQRVTNLLRAPQPIATPACCAEART